MGWELPKLEFPGRTQAGNCSFGNSQPPWAPYGPVFLQALLLQLLRSSQGRFFHPKNDFLRFLVQTIVKKKLRLRGRGHPGEIRAEILRKMASGM